MDKMVDDRLIEYIRLGLSKNVPVLKLRQILLSASWQESDIDEAINLATPNAAAPQPEAFAPLTLKTAQEESGMRQAGLAEDKPAKGPARIWIVAICILAILVIAGVLAFFLFPGRDSPGTPAQTTQPSQETAAGLEISDCGIDMGCLIEASLGCRPSKVDFESSIDVIGINITTRTYYEIKGTEAGMCVLYMLNENQSIRYSEEIVRAMAESGLTDEQIQEQEQEATRQAQEQTAGKDGTCRFSSNADLTALLNKLEQGNFSEEISCGVVDGDYKCTSSGDWSVAECEGKRFSP